MIITTVFLENDARTYILLSRNIEVDYKLPVDKRSLLLHRKYFVKTRNTIHGGYIKTIDRRFTVCFEKNKKLQRW